MDRYQRQRLLPFIGPAGQDRLAAARVLIVGCGALGCATADLLARAGVGFLRIADRDLVEPTNLQRQVLFDEEDAARATPKAMAAAARLVQINSQITLDPRVVDVHAGNVEQLAELDRPGRGVDLLLDGTDNVATRYLINDLAVKHGRPWIYAGCVGAEGRVLAIRPGAGPCLRCLFPDPPSAAELPTCDTAGVLGPAAALVSAAQAGLAIKLLSGHAEELAGQMLVVDLWAERFVTVRTAGAKNPDCPCCGQRQFDFLNDVTAAATTSLCGRNAVQIRPARPQSLDLSALAARLAAVGEVQPTPYLIRCALREMSGISLTIFPDGRILVHGTGDAARARSLVSRFVGN